MLHLKIVASYLNLHLVETCLMVNDVICKSKYRTYDQPQHKGDWLLDGPIKIES